MGLQNRTIPDHEEWVKREPATRKPRAGRVPGNRPQTGRTGRFLPPGRLGQALAAGNSAPINANAPAMDAGAFGRFSPRREEVRGKQELRMGYSGFLSG